MNEKLIERKACEGVKRKGGLAIKLLPFQFTGLPDRMFLLEGGKARFAEIKSTGKQLRPRQVVVIGMLRKLGFTVDVIDDEQTLKEFLQSLEK